MRLTKFAHACVDIEIDGVRILIDPGTFTPNSAELLDAADIVLITHEHFDHFDVDAVRDAVERRDELCVYAPASAVAALASTRAMEAGRVRTVTGGEMFTADGVAIRVFGGDHAPIHGGIAVPHNVGYLVADRVFHPGDSFATPGVPVDTLLMPVSGPWVKVGEAIDFIEAVAPARTIAVHDVMLSEVGRASSTMFLGQAGLTGIPMTFLEPGESIEL